MPLLYLTRIEEFIATQKLRVVTRSELVNLSFRGNCSNKILLGHNYNLIINANEQSVPALV